MENKDNLVFLVARDIWLPLIEKGLIGNWTEIKPEQDNGHIGTGSILTFDHIFEDVLVFTLATTEKVEMDSTPEFTDAEIKHLVQKGILVLLEGNIQQSEISNVAKPTQRIPSTIKIHNLSIEDKDKFTLLVTKDIWEATTGPLGKNDNIIKGWTEVEPSHSKGPRVTMGTVLKLVAMSKDNDNNDLLFFSLTKNGKELVVKRSFKQEDLTNLAKRGVIKLLEIDMYAPTQNDDYYPVSD